MLARGTKKPKLWRTEYTDSVTSKKIKKNDQFIVPEVKVTRNSHGKMCSASLPTASEHMDPKKPCIYTAVPEESHYGTGCFSSWPNYLPQHLYRYL